MNTPKEIEGIRFLGLEKLDEERLAVKSLINKKLSKRMDFITLFPILSRDNFLWRK